MLGTRYVFPAAHGSLSRLHREKWSPGQALEERLRALHGFLGEYVERRRARAQRQPSQAAAPSYSGSEARCRAVLIQAEIAISCRTPPMHSKGAMPSTTAHRPVFCLKDSGSVDGARMAQ